MTCPVSLSIRIYEASLADCMETGNYSELVVVGNKMMALGHEENGRGITTIMALYYASIPSATEDLAGIIGKMHVSKKAMEALVSMRAGNIVRFTRILPDLHLPLSFQKVSPP